MSTAVISFCREFRCKLRRVFVDSWGYRLLGRRSLKSYPFLGRYGRRALAQVCNELLRRSGYSVYAGPFSGMRLHRGGALTSRPMWIVGSYECEVHGIINEMIVRAPDQIIDIGSAHGYYMVGLAMQIPSATVIGFEAQAVPHWEEVLRLAAANNVTDRIRQEGLCTTDALARVCTPGTFIICDCEGGELDLLDVDKVPCLRSCPILCEVHDFHRAGTTATLISRFSESHEIRIIQESRRDPADYRILHGLSVEEKRVAVMETRHVERRLIPGKFLWMLPRGTGVDSSSMRSPARISDQ